MDAKSLFLNESVFRIDAHAFCRDIEEFIRRTVADSRRDGVVVAISGGLDSSVVAALCANALGKERVTGLLLPERFGNPEANRYGELIARHLGIAFRRIGISPVLRAMGAANLIFTITAGRERWKDKVNAYLAKSGHSIAGDYEDFLRGNLDAKGCRKVAMINAKQRVRALIAYRFADERNLLVAGSAHRTENVVGLFCKYGIDDAADLMPLKRIYRSQILQLAESLGIPEAIRKRSPNPDILPGVTDKYLAYFGREAQTVDLLLYGVEHGMTDPDIAEALNLEPAAVMKLREVIRLSAISRDHALAWEPPDSR